MPRIIPEYKEEVRKKIIGIAYQLFLSRGYRGTTMEDIAGALGVTKPALYQYFPGKEDLYAAVAEHGRQELRGILERSYQNRDILRGSAELFDAISRYAPQYQGIYSEMMLIAPRNERIRQILEEDLREDVLVIERFICQPAGGRVCFLPAHRTRTRRGLPCDRKRPASRYYGRDGQKRGKEDLDHHGRSADRDRPSPGIEVRDSRRQDCRRTG